MCNIHEIAEQSDQAIKKYDEKLIGELIQKVEKWTSSDHTNQDRCYAHYILANLHSTLAFVLKESASGWRNDNYPKNLIAEINHLRSAKKLISNNLKNDLESRIQTNLANALAHQRRNIEVLNEWKIDFINEGDAPFVSSLSKARELIWISKSLNDESHQHLYQYEAYLLLKKLNDNISKTGYRKIADTLKTDPELSYYLANGAEFFAPLKGWQTAYQADEYSADEKLYRSWCLKERLFVNPINDITTEWIADQDILQFPNHTTDIGDGPFFSAAFSSLKREYCFARFMAFEGIHQIHPKFETDKLFLVNTLDYVDYSGETEKIKTSFRVCFSVLDSLASLMNKYFKCGSEEHKVYFKPKWIRNHFKDSEINFFIDALYWLSCDLSNPERCKAPNPESAEIRKIRNAIEHGWLRVSEGKCSVWNEESDFAHIITPQDLHIHTLSLLKLVRAAMLYLTFAVKSNEELKSRRTEKSEKVNVLSPIDIMDDEFIGCF